MLMPDNHDSLESILALEGILSVRELADRLDFAGKDAGKAHDDDNALRLKEEAGKRYEKISEFWKAAISYDRASKHASYLGDQGKRYMFRKQSMKLFERVNDFYNAGFSAMHIAEALIALEHEGIRIEDPVPYISKAEEFFDMANRWPTNSNFLRTYNSLVADYIDSKRFE